MNNGFRKSVLWAVVLSEGTHVFCCVFPTLFSLLGLLAGLGIIITIPHSMIAFHDFLHDWEIPLIIFSGIILALGWAVTLYSDRIDCHDTGCAHGACAKRKSKAHIVLIVATALFIFNLIVYIGVHRAGWFADGPGAALSGTVQEDAHTHQHGHENHTGAH